MIKLLELVERIVVFCDLILELITYKMAMMMLKQDLNLMSMVNDVMKVMMKDKMVLVHWDKVNVVVVV